MWPETTAHVKGRNSGSTSWSTLAGGLWLPIDRQPHPTILLQTPGLAAQDGS